MDEEMESADSTNDDSADDDDDKGVDIKEHVPANVGSKSSVTAMERDSESDGSDDDND